MQLQNVSVVLFVDNTAVQAAPHVAGVAANCLMAGACESNSTGLQSMTVILEAAKDRVSMGSPVVKYSAEDTVALGKWFGYLLYAEF